MFASNHLFTTRGFGRGGAKSKSFVFGLLDWQKKRSQVRNNHEQRQREGDDEVDENVRDNDAEGSEITTVEGLADGHHLSPIQNCFAEYGGSQCGFCTPGFLISTQALLNQTDDPSEEEISKAIEGNLCRCTGYQQISDSIRAAASILRGEKENKNPTITPHSNPHPIGPEEPNMPPGHAR